MIILFFVVTLLLLIMFTDDFTDAVVIVGVMTLLTTCVGDIEIPTDSNFIDTILEQREEDYPDEFENG
jgi:hypothetical protein